MRTRISRWGNSLALRLPRHLAEGARLVEGTTVTVEVEDGSLRITPSRKKFRLSDLLEGQTPGVREAEHDWGRPKGDEVW